MPKVIPVGYILTDEALKEHVTADPEWQRLNAEWQQAEGDAKQKARLAANEIQDRITEALFSAVKTRELSAIALKRTASGDWVEHILANEYLESFGGDMALWTGSVERLGLEPSDSWISDAPLCFRRSDLDRWAAALRPPPSTPPKPSGTYWTPIQAVEWIATRDRLAVASVRSDLRRDALYSDDVREDVTSALAFHRLRQHDTHRLSLVPRRDALELLVEACRAGSLIVLGLERSTGESVEIPVSAWAHRTIEDSPHGVACRPDDRFNVEAAWWNQLRFLRARVEALWPAMAAEPEDSTLSAAAKFQAPPTTDAQDNPKQAELIDWGIKVCATVRGAGKRISKGPFVSAAWERFGSGSGLTVDSIGSAWTVARESAGWPRAGNIPVNLRMKGDDLRELLIGADLLRR